jgi:hypothetical protein
MDEALRIPSIPSFSSVSSTDFYDLKIRQDSIESAYASQIESISATLISLAKITGPSVFAGALLQANEQLKVLTVSLAMPYSERDSFLMRNGTQSSTFRSSLLKEVASSRKTAKKSLSRRRSPNYLQTRSSLNRFQTTDQPSMRQSFGRGNRSFRNFPSSSQSAGPPQ